MRTTIRKFIETFPKEKCLNTPRLSLKDKTYDEKMVLLHQPACERMILTVNNERIYFAKMLDQVRRTGNKFYVKSGAEQYLYISTKETNTHCNPHMKREFLEICGITWCKEIENRIIHQFFTPSILKSILIGTIYNQETLYKAIAKRMFRVKVSWRLLREYLLLNGWMPNITDLSCFTKNVETSMRELIGCNNSYRRDLLDDTLDCAIKLNEVVDFKWSDNRLYEEHKRQTLLLTQRQLNSKAQIPIFKPFDCGKDIVLLNTERDIFIEGTEMHHCLYNCYYDRIKDHDYMAFHMRTPEDCTFSVELRDGKPILHQIYLKYDKSVQPKTRQIALDFIQEYEDELIERFHRGFTSNIDLPYEF